MTVSLSPATRRDLRPIAAILQRCRCDAGWLPACNDRARYRADAQLLLTRTEVTLARRNRDVLGFIARSGRIVHALYLWPEARGQGLGKGLLEEAKTAVDRLDLWTYQANRPARRFYARQGFYENRLTSGEGNDEKLPDVHMVWARGAA